MPQDNKSVTVALVVNRSSQGIHLWLEVENKISGFFAKSNRWDVLHRRHHIMVSSLQCGKNLQLQFLQNWNGVNAGIYLTCIQPCGYRKNGLLFLACPSNVYTRKHFTKCNLLQRLHLQAADDTLPFQCTKWLDGAAPLGPSWDSGHFPSSPLSPNSQVRSDVQGTPLYLEDALGHVCLHRWMRRVVSQYLYHWPVCRNHVEWSCNTNCTIELSAEITLSGLVILARPLNCLQKPRRMVL
jgi:hypothetical protein